MKPARPLTFLLALSFSSICLAEENETAQWIDLLKPINLQQAPVAGTWTKNNNGLSTDAVASSRLTLPYQPKTEYDFRVKFTRNSGVHSIALFFVVGSGQAAFDIDAWGQHLAGLQNINRQTLQTNSARIENITLENGQEYTARIEVRKDRVRAYLDQILIAEHRTDGSDLSVPDVWRMPDSKSLGIGAYSAATTFHSIEVRPLNNGAALASATPAKPATPTPSPTTPSNRPNASGKRVLLVIANRDFYYREYHDPREELERAGIEVEVAAGRKEMCRPHANSGQQGNGDVMPDLALSDVDVSRYDAIMFSGGWGSSMYQYAFEGSYQNRVYNGDRQIKATVNKLLNEFTAQDKYVGALCHGISILAWARVNDKSLLAGRRAVGSPRQSPAGIYNGQRGQPLSRWNVEVNGARITPVRSIGDPSTSADDVLVDGKLITGEDDNSARLFGRALAGLLTESKD